MKCKCYQFEIQLKFHQITNGNHLEINPVEIPIKISMKYHMKFQLYTNGNLLKIQLKCEWKYQWKSIRNPVEIWKKFKWNTYRNQLEIHLEFQWTDGRTDIRGFGTDRLPYSEKLFLIVIFTDPTIISGTVDLRHYVIDTESVALTTSFFQEGHLWTAFHFFCIFNKGFSKDHKFSLFYDNDHNI